MTDPSQSAEAILALLMSPDGPRKIAADHLTRLAINEGVYSVNLKTNERLPVNDHTVAAWASRRPDLVRRLRERQYI